MTSENAMRELRELTPQFLQFLQVLFSKPSHRQKEGKMKRLLIIAWIASLILIGFNSQPAYAAGEHIYVVQPGDTLFTIAARYGISVNDLAVANGLNNGYWVYAGQQLIIPISTSFATPSTFARAAQQPSDPRAVGFIPLSARPASAGVYTVQPGDTLYSLAYRYGIDLADLQAANGLTDFSLPIYSGQQLVMPGGATASSPAPTLAQPALSTPPHLTVASPVNAPRQAWAAYSVQPPNFYGPAPSGMLPASFSTQPAFPAASAYSQRWIDVDLTRQTLTAYEGQRPVFGTRVSTGIWQYPTIVGTFSIYVKYEAADMEGGSGDDAYYLSNVPYVMYFHDNYGLHGTYWHNNFGTPMSHGCVNLPTLDAQWLFNWAPLGTKVVTHY
jgi:LysM repeat protein